MNCGSSTPTPTIQVNNISVTEGNKATFTVNLSARNTSTAISLSLLNGTATVGNDFSSALEYYNGSSWVPVVNNTVTVAANVTSLQVRTQTVNDTIFEGNETFTLKATANGSSDTGIATIVDNDTRPVVQAVSNVTVTEGQQAVFTIDLTNTSTTTTKVQLTLASGSASVGSSTSNDVSNTMQVSYFNGTNWSTWASVSNNSVDVPAGVQKFQVRSQTRDDSTVEATETFTLTAKTTAASMSCGGTPTVTSNVTGTGTILDNDSAALPTLNPITAATATEGNNVVFTIGLSAASTTATTVNLTLANGTTASADLGALEYFNGSSWVAATNNQAIIAAGQTSVQVRTLAVVDGVYEGSEGFTLTASANGSTRVGNGTVTDVAPGLANIAAATAAEGGYVQFQVGLAGGSTSTTATNVALSLANGTTAAGDLGGLEYFNGSSWVSAANGAVIAAGQNAVQVRTLAVVDGVYEGPEGFTLTATANGSTKSGAGSVTDTAAGLADIAAATAAEGGYVQFQVGLAGSNTSTTDTNVALSLTNGTTVAGDLGGLEYFNGSSWVSAAAGAVIAAGQNAVQVRTLAVNDSVYEGPEGFTLTASANGSTKSGNGTVTDTAAGLADIAAATAAEGGYVQFQVGLAGGSTSTTATNVALSLANGSTAAGDLGALEYFNGSSWVSAAAGAVIAAGQNAVQVRTLAVNDTVYEGSEDFTLTATANGTTKSGAGSVTDTAAGLADIAAATAAEGGYVQFQVGLVGSNTSTTDTNVALSLANGTTAAGDLGGLEYFNGSSWVSAANGAVIAAGQNAVQVRTLAVNDSVYEGSEGFTLTASANGSTKSGAGTVTDTAAGLADIAAATAAEGGYVQFQVGLAGSNTSTTDTNVALSLADGSTAAGDLGGLEYQDASGSWVSAAAGAVIAAGQNAVQVRTLAVNDIATIGYEGAETFTLMATANGSTKSAAGTVTDIAPTLNPIAAASATEGGYVGFNIGLSSMSATDTTVGLTLTNGSTTATDLGTLEYLSGSSWVSAASGAVVAAGATSVQVRILAVDDTDVENTEGFTLDATAFGTTQSANGSILDNDVAGNIIQGTTGNDPNLVGTGSDDIIYGNGGEDTIYGLDGNDTIYAGNPTDPTNTSSIIYGDGGNDIITGGSGINLLYGSNDTLLGAGEQDTLTGGGTGSNNLFVLGGNQGSYYVGGGNNDYANIFNFDTNSDFIQLTGQASDYTITYNGGVASIFQTTASGSDLIAQINSAPAGLDLSNDYFSYANYNP